MDKGKTLDPEEVWRGDLLGRAQEATLLADYIRSVALRKVTRSDAHAFTIAVDADYGVGKTFFLRHFRDHIAPSHPVAFVDAWADDLADEPLTALAATLSEALAPLSKKTKAMNAWKRVQHASGEVAKAAAMGLAQRALAAIFTSAGAEVFGQAFQKLGKETASAVAAEVAEVADEAAVAGVEAFANTPSGELMSERIQQFKAGKVAVDEMKGALSDLVAQLPLNGLRAPIVIVIDELDRCRPTYAIKLLEEIKHLFDVQGLVFVLGVNTRQLAEAVRGTYGLRFDGKAYLRRFINRTYTLRTPSQEKLIEQLLLDSGIPDEKFEYPPQRTGFDRMPVSKLLASYCDVYGATPRDAYGLMDKLQTCAALTGPVPLLVPYLVPLIIAELRTGKRNGLTDALKPDVIYFGYYKAGAYAQLGLQELAQRLDRLSRTAPEELDRRINRDDADFALRQLIDVKRYAQRAGNLLGDPQLYPQLLDTVGQFGPRDIAS